MLKLIYDILAMIGVLALVLSVVWFFVWLKDWLDTREIRHAFLVGSLDTLNHALPKLASRIDFLEHCERERSGEEHKARTAKGKSKTKA